MFQLWCGENDIDPLTCGFREVLLFLQDQLNKGKAPSTLKGMVAAIKAARVGECKLDEGTCTLVKKFLRGAQRLRARVSAPIVPPWDLELVLGALRRPPFEPLGSADLKWLSIKTAFLLAVTTAKRVGELQALSVHEELCRFKPDNGGVVLRLNPAFLPKVLSDSHLSQRIELYPFSPPGDQVPGQSPLCPVRALQLYIRATQTHRATDQLFVCYKRECLGASLSKARLSH